MTLEAAVVDEFVIVKLPAQIAERLHVQNGGPLFLSKTENGIELSPANEDFAAQMKIADQIMDEDRDALRRLAQPAPVSEPA